MMVSFSNESRIGFRIKYLFYMIHKLTIVLILFLSQNYFGQESLSRKDRKKFKKAVELGDKKEYNAAIEFLTELIIDNKNESTLYSKRGVYYYSIMEYQRALDDFNEGLVHNYSNYEAFIFRWSCYYSLEMYNEALVDLKILLTVQESSLNYYYIGGCYEKLNQFQLAVNYLDTAILFQDLDSDLEQCYLHRGFSNKELQNYEPAIDDFTKVLTYNDTNYVALINRSNCFRHLNLLEKASKDMELILENDSLNPYIYHEL